MARTGRRFAVLMTFLVTMVGCGGSSSSATVATDVGITSSSILLGNTIAQSGAAAAYGTIAYAEAAYFNYINTQGGINGRSITYKILDDGYNPANTVPLTKQLVEQDQVFAMFSGLGTQAQTAVQPYLNGKHVPQLFIATGATTFSKDYSQNTWTLGWQPAYQAESRIYAADILKNHAGAKIGILQQNDDYGADYVKGLTDGLGSNAASMIIDTQKFDITAADVTSQMVHLAHSGADTFFLFATPGFAIKALVTATKLGWAPQIYLNAVSADQLWMGIAGKAGAKLDGITSVGYLKDPTDPQWANDAGMQLYKTVIGKCPTCNANDGFNVYGVAVAYTMVDVLKQAGSNMTRANVMNIAANQLNETNPFLLPGVSVKTTSSDHFPITEEQVIIFQNGLWHLQGSLIEERGTIK